MEVLYDESVTIDNRFTLIGRKDHSDKARIELSAVMNGLDLSKPIIMLDHQPRDFDIAQQHGVDLMVSGNILTAGRSHQHISLHSACSRMIGVC